MKGGTFSPVSREDAPKMQGLSALLLWGITAAAASAVPPAAVPLTLRGGGVPGLRAAPLRGGGPALSHREKKLFQDLSKGPGIYSADEPAEHAGREDKHIPTLTITNAGAEVVVKHVMDDGASADKVLLLQPRHAPLSARGKQRSACGSVPD